MIRALAVQLARRIDETRAPYVLIGAGVVYLVAFNTVLCVPDIWYFGFLILVLVLCAPLVLRAREPTVDKSGESERGLALLEIDQ